MYRRSGKEKESQCLVFTSSKKREIFTSSLCSDGKKNVQKQHDAKLLLCLSEPISFLTFSLTSPSSFLKLPCK